MRLTWISLGLLGIALRLGGASGLSWGSAAEADDIQATFYPNGQIQSRARRVDGQRDGTAGEWYANGQERCSGEYRAGVREGAWVFFKSDGTIDLERTGTYANGSRLSP
jgi:antitoxin component YwqK of YwqJK toxin-antitoxin module